MYETKTVMELREEVRTRPSLRGSWIATATKGALIAALEAHDKGGIMAPYPLTAPRQATIPQPLPTDPESPEERILSALKELKGQQQTSSPLLDDLKAQLEAYESNTSQAIVSLNNAVVDSAQRITDLAARTPRAVAITVGALPAVTIKTAHCQLEKLIKMLSHRQCNGKRVNVLMVGPAGSGKTHMAEQAAEVLGQRFFAISVGPQTTMSHLMGYKDAQGVYQSTLFRDAVEHGGVFLFDEFDAGDACVLTVINAATSNGKVGFPDGMVNVHEDFVCIAAGNTYGRGADRQYVGRNQLDAATLARFCTLTVDYDTALEDAITSDVKWRDRVRQVRDRADRAGVRVVISTRAIMQGEALLAAGLSQDEVEESVLFKGMDPSTRAKIA